MNFYSPGKSITVLGFLLNTAATGVIVPVIFLFFDIVLHVCFMLVTAHATASAVMAATAYQHYQQKSPNNNPDAIALQKLNHWYFHLPNYLMPYAPRGHIYYLIYT